MGSKTFAEKEILDSHLAIHFTLIFIDTPQIYLIQAFSVCVCVCVIHTWTCQKAYFCILVNLPKRVTLTCNILKIK